MSTSTEAGYQIWLMRDQGASKIPIPILPETYELRYGNKVTSYDIVGLGEAIAYKDPDAAQLTFSSYFPVANDPATEWYVGDAYSPLTPVAYEEMFRGFLNDSKILQIVIIGTPVNMFCRCSGYSTSEGECGAGQIDYTLTLTEHRETSIEKVNVDPSTNMAELPPTEPRRLDTRINPQTVMSQPGDTLTSIVRRLAGSGTDTSQIYAMNSDVLKNPQLLEPGTTLRIPQ